MRLFFFTAALLPTPALAAAILPAVAPAASSFAAPASLLVESLSEPFAEGIDARALEALFSLCDDGGAGGVRARVIPPPSGAGAPSAFVTLTSLAGALRAACACGGVRLGGVPLEAELAKRHAGAAPPPLGAWGEWRGERLPLTLLRARHAAAGGGTGSALLTPDLLRAAVCGGFAAAAPIVERGVAMEALAAFRFSEEDAAAAAALGGASMEY